MKKGIININDSKFKLKIINLLIYTIVLLASLDIFSYYFSIYLKGYSVYSILILAVLILIVNNKKIVVDSLHKKQATFFIIWTGIYIVINQFVAKFVYTNAKLNFNINIFVLQLFEVICVFIVYYYIDSIDSDKLKINVIRIIISSMVVDAFFTLKALVDNPKIARTISIGTTSSNTYDLKGVSSYSVIYSIVIILPLFYVAINKFKLKYRAIIILFITLMVIFVYKAGYTIAIGVILFGVLLYLYLNMTGAMKIVTLPLIMALLIIILDHNLIYNILMQLSQNVQVNSISLRMQELANMVMYGNATGDSLARLGLYKQSIDAFLKYPITGIIIFEPNYLLSGHSSFLDILGGSGLVGFIPYIMFIWYSYRVALCKTNSRKLKNAIRTSYIMFCLVGSIDVLTTSFTIMLFVLFFINWYPSLLDSMGDRFMLKNSNYQKYKGVLE